MAHLVRHATSPVPDLPPEASVRDAARAIAASRGDRALIVTPDGDRAVVTAADVVRAVAEARRLGSTRALTISRPEDVAAADPEAATTLDAVLDLTLAVAVSAAVRADGASVIVHAGALRRVAATAPDLQAVDQLQLDLGDGPGFEAMSTLAVQQVALRPSASPWPNYHRAALAHGMRRALCLPLVADGEVVGALSLFWRDAGPFSEEAERAAELVSGRAARAIASTGALDALPPEQPAETAEPVPEPRVDDLPADESRDEVVAEAQGILRSRKQYSDAEAFATLRDASERTRKPLPDVAREVVELPDYMRPKAP